jgi:hypothetical protein
LNCLASLRKDMRSMTIFELDSRFYIHL